MSEIDIRQHLPAKTSVVNSFRLQHGDMDGITKGEGEAKRITAAWTVDNTILGKLLEVGYLEMLHKAYAMSFLDLQRAFKAGQGIKWGMINGAEEANLSAGDAAERYQRICTALGWDKVPIIFETCTEIANEEDFKKDRNIFQSEVKNVIRAQFENLVKIMDEESENRKETLEGHEGVR